MTGCPRCGCPLVPGAGEHAACPRSVPQASPVEGPMGDPHAGGSPPPDEVPPTERTTTTPTVPGPPHERDTEDLRELPPCSS